MTRHRAPEPDLSLLAPEARAVRERARATAGGLCAAAETMDRENAFPWEAYRSRGKVKRRF